MLAEILDIPLDPIEVRKEEWVKLQQKHSNFEWDGRHYLEYDFFTDYFKKYIDIVANKFGKYKNIIVQYRNSASLEAARWSHVLHKDAYRSCMVTIPFSDITDPVAFYTEDSFRGRDIMPSKAPILMSFYSKDYAVFMDGQVYHNVLVIDRRKPRILLQINYDEPYQSLYKPETMKLITYDKKGKENL